MLRNTTYILYLVGGRIFDVFDSEIQGWSFQWLDTGHFHCEHLRHPTCAATAMAFCMVNWNFRILWYGGTVPYKGIFWGYIPLHRPYIGLIYSRYLKFRFLKWPLIWGYFKLLWFPTLLTLLHKLGSNRPVDQVEVMISSKFTFLPAFNPDRWWTFRQGFFSDALGWQVCWFSGFSGMAIWATNHDASDGTISNSTNSHCEGCVTPVNIHNFSWSEPPQFCHTSLLYNRVVSDETFPNFVDVLFVNLEFPRSLIWNHLDDCMCIPTRVFWKSTGGLLHFFLRSIQWMTFAAFAPSELAGPYWGKPSGPNRENTSDERMALKYPAMLVVQVPDGRHLPFTVPMGKQPGET